MDLYSVLSRYVCQPYLVAITGKDATIVERIEPGAGEAIFESKPGMIQIDHSINKPLIRWLRATKCADGALLWEQDNLIFLHVVELKKTVTAGKLEEIKHQIDGMILNIRAMIGIAQITNKVVIKCHIAYEFEKLTIDNVVDSINYKRQLGVAGEKTAVIEWETGQLKLKFAGEVPFKKIVRSGVRSAGNGDLS